MEETKKYGGVVSFTNTELAPFAVTQFEEGIRPTQSTSNEGGARPAAKEDIKTYVSARYFANFFNPLGSIWKRVGPLLSCWLSILPKRTTMRNSTGSLDLALVIFLFPHNFAFTFLDPCNADVDYTAAQVAFERGRAFSFSSLEVEKPWTLYALPFQKL